MKKLISILCVLALVLSVAAFSAYAADDVSKGSTAVDVKSGDQVSYTLVLDKVEQPIIGSDFSVYYDSSVFELESVADFNDKTNEEDWEATINPELDGQVRGVWSILKGVDFSSKRNFITVNLKAKTDASNSHITYRVRYLYDNDVFNSSDYPQITTYLFTCNVKVNGEEVLKDAAPEVNVDKEPENGKFVNSLDGDSEHADPEIPGVVDKTKDRPANGVAQENDADYVLDGNNNGGGNAGGNGGSNNDSANNGGNNGGGSGNVSGGSNNNAAAKTSDKTDAKADAAPAATTADGYFVKATDANGNVTATTDQAPVSGSSDKKGGSPVLWIVIVLVVLAGGGAAAYFYMKKKPAPDAAPAEENQDASAAESKEAPENTQDQ